jgi:hypothetical protein
MSSSLVFLSLLLSRKISILWIKPKNIKKSLLRSLKIKNFISIIYKTFSLIGSTLSSLEIERFENIADRIKPMRLSYSKKYFIMNLFGFFGLYLHSQSQGSK